MTWIFLPWLSKAKKFLASPWTLSILEDRKFLSWGSGKKGEEKCEV
jgi:hypothetical protein